MYLRARYYDPVPGRFLQRDPLDYSCSRKSVLAFHRYAYAENNPINRADPAGTQSLIVPPPPEGVTPSVFHGPIQQCIWIGPFPVACRTVTFPVSPFLPARPMPEACGEDCEKACEQEQLRCEQDWFARKRLGEVNRDIGCEHGYNQCISTGGCFLNPGWRQDGGREEWQKVWWGRKEPC